MNRRRMLAATLALATALGVAGPAAAAYAPTPGIERLGIIGDSITAWDPPYGGDIRSSWVPSVLDDTFRIGGGYARPGYKIAQIESSLMYTEVDTFVMLVGTNDLAIPYKKIAGTPLAARFAAMDRMVAKMHAEHVLVVAVPPFGWTYAVGNEWNAQLKSYAAARGFVFVDPWVGAKDSRGYWLPGAHKDGVHPTAATAAAAGEVIRSTMVGQGWDQ